MKANFTPIFCLLFLFISCGVSDVDVLQLQEKNAALQAKNDSLVHVIEQLEQSPDEVVHSAKQLMDEGKKDSARQMLRHLSQRSLTTRDAAEVARLLKGSKVKDFKKHSSADVTRDATSEPVAIDVPTAENGQMLNSETVKHNWSAETKAPTIKHPVHEKIYNVRVGAICRDGTRSSATGRGACSHHGGVSEWVYE